ncbi:MAG: hypothetical protein MUF83_00480 [Acidimicrobiales bacterium]|jgi:hypothetical protein|nr:hypothetical protein [Acidimicrobiales bacterium]
MAQITNSDIESVATKLEDFAQSLNPEERALLGSVLARAEAAGEAEVEGFALQSYQLAPMNNQLYKSAGLRPQALKPGVGDMASVTVSWSW